MTHAHAVEGVMRHWAALKGEDVEYWGAVGLLLDLDYEKYPDQHCVKCVQILREHNVAEDIIHAICSHGYGICYDVKPERYMEKVLYTVDELTGKQLTFDNVVVCFANIAAYAGDSHDVQEVQYVQGGQAYLFTHGGVQTGRWEKPHPTHPLKLYTDSGEEMTLNRGKTYLALVDDDEWSRFNYQ